MHPFEDLHVPERAVGIHWFEQNSFALKDAAGTIVLIDPYFPHDRAPERFLRREPPVDEAGLRTDAVLMTHDHGDHTYIPTLMRIRDAWPKARYYGPKESIERMVRNGFPESLLVTVSAGETFSVGSMTVHATWAKPMAGDPVAGIPPTDVVHLGYVIEAGGVRVYDSGDEINTFAELDELVEPVKALRPDIGLLTTHPTEGEFPFFDGSVKMAQRIGLKAVVPAHLSCFTERDYCAEKWAAQFPANGPKTIIIPYNSAITYSLD